MAPGHVPSEQHPPQGTPQGHPQGQPLYNETPSYDQFFPRQNAYPNGAPAWDQFSQTPHGSAFPQQVSNPQPWQVHSQQPYSSAYGNPAQGYQIQPSYQQQYSGPYGNHTPQSGYGRPAVVDPALQDSGPVRTQQQSPYQQALRAGPPQGQPTVSPQVLQQNALPLQNARATASPYQIPKSTTEMFSQPQRALPPSITASQPVSKPDYVIPKGKWSGSFYVIDQSALAKATKSAALNKFVTVATEPIYLATNRTALPVYTPRQSIKDMKKSGAGNKKLLDRQAQKLKSSSTRMLVAKSAASRIGAGSPSAQSVDTDSSDYSDSSESEYSDSEEEEVSPLPSARPNDPLAGTRYDVIKTSWLPRHPQPTPEKIKQCIAELWEVISTIHKRWRLDSKAVTEAEEAKKLSELPVLKSRVTGQRDMLQSALKAVLEFAHPNVLWNLGRLKQFLYVSYQFLANRFKDKDFDGELSVAIYQVLARFDKALTAEILEETKLSRALNSMKKGANAANKALIQQIIDRAAESSKEAKVSSPPRDDATDAKNGKRSAPVPTGQSRSAVEGPAAKKLKTPDPVSTLPKQISTATPKVGQPPNTAPQKRPGEKSTSAPVKARVNPVVNKNSGFFSALSAANKKPTPTAQPATSAKPAQSKPAGITAVKDKKPASAAAKPASSFKDMMALLNEPKKEPVAAPKPEKKLPPETPDEKAKRLRKESRRHLRVQFRPDANLVDIRYFSHDPEEEQGHDENFVRDAGDIGGEGRMFKQHRDMEDDEESDEEAEVTLREWTEPRPIDFSMMPPEAAVANYMPYGGGTKTPTCPEKEANERREASVLMVYYSSPADIPPTPREPPEENEERKEPVRFFGNPPEKQSMDEPTAPPSVPGVDLNFLQTVVSQLKNQQPQTQPPTSQPVYIPPVPPLPTIAPTTPYAPDPSANLSALLSSLTRGQNQQPAFPQPAPANPPLPVAMPGPTPDLNALMAQLQQAAPPAMFPPAPPGPIPAEWAQFFQQAQTAQVAQAAPVDPNYQYQQQQSQYNQASGGGTKRQRNENNHDNDRGHGSFKKAKNGKNANWHGDRPHKVLPCKFFHQGKCNKGDDCTYIHDRN